MDTVIETRGLSKDYGSVRALSNVDLRVLRGEIYGFLGLNGAGKTTAIRLFLGMIHPSNGSVQVLGQPVGPNGRGPWQGVGHMVESAAAYPELSVWENLEISRRLHGLHSSEDTKAAISLFRLDEYAYKRAGTLSTGNLQRLGLARALLHQPELLILDEPTNGLDPAGVVEIRQMLTHLAHEKGVTIFMSSHILTEVDRLATRIGIIHQGHLIEELSIGDLERLRAFRLEVSTHDDIKAMNVLIEAGFNPQTRTNQLILTDARALKAPDAVAILLVNAGVPPRHLALAQDDLETHFLRLIGSAV